MVDTDVLHRDYECDVNRTSGYWSTLVAPHTQNCTIGTASCFKTKGKGSTFYKKTKMDTKKELQKINAKEIRSCKIKNVRPCTK